MGESIPPIKEFNDNNKDVISSLTGIIGVLLGVAGIIVGVVGRRGNHKPDGNETGPHVEADRRGVAVGGDAKGDIITGDNPIVADKVEIYNAPVVTGVQALHQIPSPPRDFTGRSAELQELMEAVM